MLDPNALSDEVLSALAQRFDIPSEHFDKLFLQIRAMSPEEALNAFLEWHGIVNYTAMILRAGKSIEAAEVKPLTPKGERDEANLRRLEFIREACGYIQDGSSTTFTIQQDDATQEWIASTANDIGYGRTFETAIDDLVQVVQKADAEAAFEKSEHDRQKRINARDEERQRRSEIPGDSRDPDWIGRN